jgi:hypothetical protein
MRPFLLAACVLVVAAPAFAQDAPRPFVSAEPSFRTTIQDVVVVDRAVGLDVTVGTRGWRRVQPVFHGGRLIDVTPADLIPSFSFEPGVARHTSTWYGAAGARFLPPGLWRFQPYLETTGGVAHMKSEVLSTSGFFLRNHVAPMFNYGAGAELQIGDHFAIDAGYKWQNFLGDASVQRRGPRLAFGVRF